MARKIPNERDHIDALLKLIFLNPDIPEAARIDLLTALSNLSALVYRYLPK